MTIELTPEGLAEVNTADTVYTEAGMTNSGYSDCTLRIDYAAVLDTDSSVIFGDTGNPNTVVLTWRRISSEYYDILIDDCHIFTYGLALTKLFSDGKGNFNAIAYDAIRQEYKISLKGALSHLTTLGTDLFGNFTRMDNVLATFSQRLERKKAELAELTHQLENAKAELETPFSREAELAEKEARLKELNILLNMDEKDDALIDDAPDEDAADRPAIRDRER